LLFLSGTIRTSNILRKVPRDYATAEVLDFEIGARKAEKYGKPHTGCGGGDREISRETIGLYIDICGYVV